MLTADGHFAGTGRLLVVRSKPRSLHCPCGRIESSAQGKCFQRPTHFTDGAGRLCRLSVRYFVQRLLKVEPIVEPTSIGRISPLDPGNIIHHAMDTFLRAEKACGSLPGLVSRDGPHTTTGRLRVGLWLGERTPVEIAVDGGSVHFVGRIDKIDRAGGTVPATDIKCGGRSHGLACARSRWSRSAGRAASWAGSRYRSTSVKR